MQQLDGTKKDDRYFLSVVVRMSCLALDEGYSPTAALLVDKNGETISAYCSRRTVGGIHHGEFLALTNYQQRLADGHDLDTDGVVLYTALEPCLMCMGIATVARVSKVVYLVDDHWGGAAANYNLDSEYLKSRAPCIVRADHDDLRGEMVELWVDYLKRTGASDYIPKVLGGQVDASYH